MITLVRKFKNLTEKELTYLIKFVDYYDENLYKARIGIDPEVSDEIAILFYNKDNHNYGWRKISYAVIKDARVRLYINGVDNKIVKILNKLGEKTTKTIKNIMKEKYMIDEIVKYLFSYGKIEINFVVEREVPDMASSDPEDTIITDIEYNIRIIGVKRYDDTYKKEIVVEYEEVADEGLIPQSWEMVFEINDFKKWLMNESLFNGMNRKIYKVVLKEREKIINKFKLNINDFINWIYEKKIRKIEQKQYNVLV